MMSTDLIRAQHYRELAEKLRDTAENEPDDERRNELLGLANQYQRLVERLVAKIALSATRDDPPDAG
jgi:ribosomal protein L17